jgi:uncharacterized membrane protein YhdT
LLLISLTLAILARFFDGKNQGRTAWVLTAMRPPNGQGKTDFPVTLELYVWGQSKQDEKKV